MDAPKIAEKIKFWEEQDRINKALIPRVVRAHELIQELAKAVSGFSDAIASTESRVTTTFNEQLARTREEQQTQSNQVAHALRSDLVAAQERIVALEQAIEEMRGLREGPLRSLRRTAIVGIVLGAVALIVALVHLLV